MFFIAILKLSLITGNAFLITPAYLHSMNNRYRASNKHSTQITVIQVLLTFKKLMYLTLAELIPSFNFSGEYSAKSMMTENAINIPMVARTMIQKKSPAHKNIRIISTIDDPRAIKHE